MLDFCFPPNRPVAHVDVQRPLGFIIYVELQSLFSVFQLLAHARSLQVELSPRAEKLIHGYYVASRRVRTQSQGGKMSVVSINLL